WLIPQESAIMSAVTSANEPPEGDETRSRLAKAVRDRRLQIPLSVRAAAEKAGMARSTWIALEEATRRTAETNYVGIEDTLHWQRGSIVSILSGGDPKLSVLVITDADQDHSTLADLKSGPTASTTDDPLIRIMKNPDLSDEQKAKIIRTLIAEQDEYARNRAEQLIHDALQGGA
ncbi:hypothetical protein, partial [Paractinoplanes toevensis]|uniref:hypothetical protein n=1 Tax=Paractinoplanes toevensis TaxID=571911 RepID=UPI001BB32FDF